MAYRYDVASQLCWTSNAAGAPGASCATSPGGATVFTYDPAGRQTGQATGANTLNANYDNWGRIDSVARTTAGVTTAQARSYTPDNRLAGTVNTGGLVSTEYLDWTLEAIPELAGVTNGTAVTTLYSSNTGDWTAQQAGPTITTIPMDIRGPALTATGSTGRPPTSPTETALDWSRCTGALRVRFPL